MHDSTAINGWHQATLDECCDTDAPICYGILMPGEHVVGGVPVIKVKNLEHHKLRRDALLHTSHTIDAQYSRSRVKTHDVLLSIRGSTGLVALVPPDLEGANITQDTARVRPKSDIGADFLIQVLQSSGVQRQIRLHTVGQAVKGINIAEVRRLCFPLPPKPERDAIAAALGQWDRATRRLERLVSSRRKLKRGVLQQLLTGQRRFPEFCKHPWVVRPLSEFFREIDVTNTDDGQSFVLSCTKLYGIISQLERFERRIASESISHYKVVKRGQLVYDPMLLWDRSIGFVKKYDSGVVSPAYSTFDVIEAEADRMFFEAMFDSHYMRHQYKVISKGTNQRRRKAESKDFLAVRVPMPPTIEEQRRIGEFVATCDRELELLRQLHHALKEQKKGLMERLLTGQVRVPASMLREAAHA